ncbi:SCO family protein [Polynucleobacter sp. MWH-Spelu-300-X4]|uniref:SCO family protein n=1 Tax=Polynucleobacter sp. MWH-Spelu-300-X4 TaxID=2689109 RepID=UPI001BFDEB93|nr:SCO family protein [Polynucleobacter sp. MWH-Spelu-300-X4]QWD79656.1 SCO family protein [Polynucleobacter sp. MWH-Spelu-300-X4]
MNINKLQFLKAFLIGLVSVLLLACSQEALKFNNVDITGSKSFGKDFSLIDHHGKQRQLADFKGKLVVMFFGYTQCPDVCPTTMNEMQGVMELMGKDADRVQVIFVTVDPERDTLDLLAQYVPAFDKRFLGMRPDSVESLQKVTKDFKVFYSKVPGKSAGSYTIDHTAGSYVFDTNGQLRLFLRHQQGPQLIAEDLKQLLR